MCSSSPWLCRSAGISTSSNFAPSCSSCQISAFIFTMSTMPLNSASDADRPCDDHRLGAEAIDHHVDAALKIRAHAVHLVDEADARNVILVGLAPHGFGLRLDTGNGVEHGNRAVEHAHGTLDFDGEVHVARRVDDVDAVVFPVAGRRGGRDRDAALLLLLHEIHGGGAVMHFADLMALARVIENALGRRRLAGIDMRGNADVAIHIERGRAGHRSSYSDLVTSGNARTRGSHPPSCGCLRASSRRCRDCSRRPSVRPKDGPSWSARCGRARR